MTSTDAYVVRIYGPVGDTPAALLAQHNFTWEVEAQQFYADYPLGNGVNRVELATTWASGAIAAKRNPWR